MDKTTLLFVENEEPAIIEDKGICTYMADNGKIRWIHVDSMPEDFDLSRIIKCRYLKIDRTRD